LYLTNQGDILATAVPGFPVWDLGGFIGSTSWGLWVAALGVVLLRPARSESATIEGGSPAGSASIPAPRPSAVAEVRSSRP
jgi:hypothetical protein